MRSIYKYFYDIFHGFYSLWTGMMTTGYYLVHPKKILTQEYPDNRGTTLYIAERFHGEVVMPHDENNEHRCTACSLCQMSCPNGSIEVKSEMIETPEGKKKKVLKQWIYHIDLCTFCGSCIDACPSDAIRMSNEFEHASYTKDAFLKVLNKPGSKLKSKEK
ncbi:MAG: 4Fe-4S binding protein [Bacteroidota bacterium]|nr:4Fe-4S binding protein [Bacteroidota bacterium]MDP4205354.1 4Fe-4S binding protein [Bacteroidota bacterium]